MGVTAVDLDRSTLELAAEAVRTRALSPVELIGAALERCEAVEPAIGAFAVVLREQAEEAARVAEAEIAQGRYRGPLHGMPVGVKDLYDMAGQATTASSEVRRDFVADADSRCVERLAAAGAVTIGKTHTHEFAFGVVTPTTRNPWDTGRIPGGSSGGTGAALAAGEVLLGLGTDTGGSIRIPASLCGVAGIKPTYGRVSRAGVTSLSWSLDHAGPLARSVRDLAIALGCLAGYDRRDPATVDVAVPDYLNGIEGGVSGLRIGVPRNHYFEPCAPAVAAAVHALAEGLQADGARLVPVTIPDADLVMAVLFAILLPEASAYHRQLLRRYADRYQPDVRLFLEAGELVLGTDYVQALRIRSRIQEGWKQMFADIDVLVAPTTAATAARVGDADVPVGEGPDVALMEAYVRTSAPANLTGLPAASVPAGFDDAGLPIGAQFIGRPFDEATVLRVARAAERIVGGWAAHRLPALAPA
jgi:aspartyl-tRNA(Asn)/glutamyl-tRNA(Gln) amidotransferase subunit A